MNVIVRVMQLFKHLNAFSSLCLIVLCQCALAVNRQTVSRPVMSAQQTREFTVPRILTDPPSVDALSVSSDGQLLVGQNRGKQLLVLNNTDGNHVTSINLTANDTLNDAVWTPRGRIVYTTLLRGRSLSSSRSKSRQVDGRENLWVGQRSRILHQAR